jgi:predicted AAA+ superfamily ATPase
MNGAFYETYVVSEIIKSYYNNQSYYRLPLYYYRDKDQKEVDLIIETIEGIYPIEIKKGINPVSSTKNFRVLSKYKKPILKGLVIDSCEKIFPINEDVYYCPISLIGL